MCASAELSSSGVGGRVWNKVRVSVLITNQVQIVKFSGCSGPSAKQRRGLNTHIHTLSFACSCKIYLSVLILRASASLFNHQRMFGLCERL